MKKLIYATAAFVSLIAPALAADQPPIKIGNIAPYTKEALMVESYKNALDMAVKEINAKGGVNGRPIEIISRDSKGEPGEAVKLAEELVEREHVPVLMNADYSSVTLAVSNWVKQNKIPFVVTASEADSIIWDHGNDYVFRTDWGGYNWMSASLKKAVDLYGDKLKDKKWAVLAPSFEFGQATVKMAKMIAQDRGLKAEWVAEQWPEWGKLDAGATIPVLERAKPNVVLCLMWTNDFAKFIREGNKRDFFKDRIFIAPIAALPEHFDTIGTEIPSGWISAGFPSDDIKEPGYLKFKEKYEAAYHEAPKTYSLNGYNSVYAIAAALEKARSDDPQKIRDALETVSFHTPFGDQHFRKIDHQATAVFWVGVTGVENGKAKLVDWSMEKVEDHMPSDSWILEQRAKGIENK